jgi:uncharacterized membrane protein
MEFQNIVFGTAGMMLLILIPGLAVSLALFPKKDDLDFIERVGFSSVLGLIPQLLQYFLDKNLSISIDTFTTYSIIVGITVVSLVVWKLRQK